MVPYLALHSSVRLSYIPRDPPRWPTTFLIRHHIGLVFGSTDKALLLDRHTVFELAPVSKLPDSSSSPHAESSPELGNDQSFFSTGVPLLASVPESPKALRPMALDSSFVLGDFDCYLYASVPWDRLHFLYCNSRFADQLIHPECDRLAFEAFTIDLSRPNATGEEERDNHDAFDWGLPWDCSIHSMAR
ncbi:hypothetical protein BO78DRAFT_31662 [Aspergillus sclerotiicarbonarius CBS 121057]|uniref:Uncharacterized protein n=1 Tax=Aspergillus sclerotiicarbonarius (strain CBS 121057 / IBT 28362) TaxID=1448318 RepID=A0A319FLM8_ASPSB|nr:hypothetical protein BO78DRAFT_31662 [Aspergillus sclerotiicarbonarius CBS 121057]